MTRHYQTYGRTEISYSTVVRDVVIDSEHGMFVVDTDTFFGAHSNVLRWRLGR